MLRHAPGSKRGVRPARIARSKRAQMAVKGPAAEAEGRGAGIFQGPVVDHPAAAVRCAAHPADAPDDEGGSAVGQRRALDKGIRDMPAQDEVGARHLGAGEDALDFTGLEGGRELRIGVPNRSIVTERVLHAPLRSP